jgi:hypothetical protein
MINGLAVGRARDLIYAGRLPPLKARLMLDLLLRAGADRAGMAAVFDRGTAIPAGQTMVKTNCVGYRRRRLASTIPSPKATATAMVGFSAIVVRASSNPWSAMPPTLSAKMSNRCCSDFIVALLRPTLCPRPQ